MKLYVCWGTFQTPRPGGHPCANAYEALKDAGHEPEVVKAHGFGPLRGPFKTGTRRLVEEHTGSSWVPALETDDGEWIGGSKQIAEWAQRNPAGAAVSS